MKNKIKELVKDIISIDAMSFWIDEKPILIETSSFKIVVGNKLGVALNSVSFKTKNGDWPIYSAGPGAQWKNGPWDDKLLEEVSSRVDDIEKRRILHSLSIDNMRVRAWYER